MKQIKLLNKDYFRFVEYRENENRDYLTKLPNRKAMYSYFGALDKSTVISVMFIDIDNFKRVNDVYGHAVGDDLLRCLAAYYVNNLPAAHIFRIGGDEFVVIFEGERSDSEVFGLVSNLSENLQSMDFRHDVLSFITFSVGIVANQNASLSLDDILNRCDAALYHCKENGKNSCVMYKTLEAEEKKKQIIEDEMTAALSHNEFIPYLLPKINMLTSKVCGAELLCRWNHWIDGLRMPSEFIPVFEKNGFITTLDFYMFEEACKMKQTWTDTPLEDIVLSVNISTLSLYFKDLIPRFIEVADKYHVPHNQLEFEITESSLSKDLATISATVHKMVEAGFIVSIDNFGSGSSSLAVLTDLPVQSVDFDKEFIHATTKDHKGRQILKNLIILCKDLKLDVLAEGIEDKEQANFLVSCGCENAQGFHFSEAIPEEDFIKYALSNLGTLLKPAHFTFNNTLTATDERYIATLYPSTFNDIITYSDGPFPGLGSVYLPGGGHNENIIQLPFEILRSESYTIAMWAKTEEVRRWSVLLYAKYETGFASIVPDAWEGYSTFRVRDSKRVDGWHDASSHEIETGTWFHIAVSYNAKTEISNLYINGELVTKLNDVPAQRFCVQLQLGGDPFQHSYKGWISELYIYSEVRKPSEIKELYDSYFK